MQLIFFAGSLPVTLNALEDDKAKKFNIINASYSETGTNKYRYKEAHISYFVLG
jgi:hypothetical protein